VRVIIVGGNAGGASAAARLRRLDEKAEIVVYEKGEYIGFANCGLPYRIGHLLLSPVVVACTVTLRHSQEDRTNESPQLTLGADWVQYRERTT
jgi:uncharacterized NAD(P)/FAD-binding protein YdhS